MDSNALIQVGLFIAALSGLAIPLGRYMAGVLQDGTPLAIESWVSKKGLDLLSEMSWKKYALSMLSFNVLGLVVVYITVRLQQFLPLNPRNFVGMSPDLALNTAISFATNTNWQAYGGESTLSNFSQMFALTVQNFLSAATGIAILLALVRGFSRSGTPFIGNFWRDLLRSTLLILLPLSFVFALTLISQGVVQSFSDFATATPIDSTSSSENTQTIALGPVASQLAIKQLGTNGGGFFNANSAHPFENPTPLSNFLELLAILIIPAALCHTFGVLIKDRRQGWALYFVMLITFSALLIPGLYFESTDNPALTALGSDASVTATQSGGNMEGKEVRFGVTNSILWAAATTAASNGSVNSMHDSLMPLAGAVAMLFMQFGEVIFGGVGSGLYGLIAFAIVTVFVSGLMVGRTPEYLGKKISSYEMKLVSLIVLVPCVLVLLGTVIGVALPSLASSITNPGPHGFSQVLYAYSSMGNNNGSAFAGFGANVPIHNILGGIIMFLSRFWIAIPILALAGALAKKPKIPEGPGTLPTHGPLFISLLISIVTVVGVLTFLPALALGPVAEHLQLVSPQ